MEILQSLQKTLICFLMLGTFNLASAQIVFEEFVGAANPFDAAAPGAYASPDFTDIDDDGDPDVFFALEDGSIAFYKNNGTAEQPVFDLQTGENNPLQVATGIAYAGIAFADVDGDGDDDAFVSSVYAWIKYYKNTGTAQEPVYEQQTGESNPLDNYEEGFEAKLDFIDIDNDGDVDVFIGDDYGNLRFYKNEGTATQPLFTEQLGIDNPLEQVYVGDFVKPAFADLDFDSDYDLLLGVDNGSFHYFENTGTPETPDFIELTGNENPFISFNTGVESKPAFTDLDGDGDEDLIAGNEDGNIHYYANQSTYTGLNRQKDDGSLQILVINKNGLIGIIQENSKPTQEPAIFKLFNINGRLIYSTEVSTKPPLDIKLPVLPSGIFLFQFQNGTKTKTTKFIF